MLATCPHFCYSPPQNYVFLFSDGSSNIRETETIPQAIDLRISGGYVIDMAVGQDIDMMELRGIASDPVTRNVLTVNSFTQMGNLMREAVVSVCNGEALNAELCGPRRSSASVRDTKH